MINPINVDGEWSTRGLSARHPATTRGVRAVHPGRSAVLRDVLADHAAPAGGRSALRFDDDVASTRPSFDETLSAKRAALCPAAAAHRERDRDADSRTRGCRTASVAGRCRRTILNGLGDRTRDTLVIYLSDNGFLFGEHRRFGKTDAYEGSVRVPMVIRYPAMLTSATTSHTLVSNVDIAPTLASLAGLPWQADGRSLVPLLDGTANSVRSALLIEHCRGKSVGSVPCSGLSFYAHQTRAGGYWGVITARDKYVRYDTGDRELSTSRRIRPSCTTWSARPDRRRPSPPWRRSSPPSFARTPGPRS